MIRLLYTLNPKPLKLPKERHERPESSIGPLAQAAVCEDPLPLRSCFLLWLPEPWKRREGCSVGLGLRGAGKVQEGLRL